MVIINFTVIAILSLLVNPTIALAEPTVLTGMVTHVRDGEQVT